ncbi:MOB kinase activator 2 isoform X1 [Nomascus leucogenys]|uniref:MOB kinase activator 2 isoform X1 n=1 Tax=Nomascus leucogenys TaxID=61853 RepID=UPI00122D5766|nr:MOB kinase activator 2 isoform X1 [Nomascus leucogenys]
MDWLMGKSKAKPNGKKPAAEERKAYLEPEHTKARITDFQFKELVVLPREIDLNEWLASNSAQGPGGGPLPSSLLLLEAPPQGGPPRLVLSSPLPRGETVARGQAELTQLSSCTVAGSRGGRGGSALVFFTAGSFSSLPATTFFHHINLQYSTISEFCTGETCQTMAVCNTQYYWYDERGKKVKCTAPQYVDFVMSSVQKLVTDEDVFPTKYGREFPSSFESLVRKICRHLFHVLAHIYWAHFKETLALELHGHLNTLYVHFILFAREFNLLDPKETAIMDDLTEVLCSGAGGVHSGGSGDGAGSGGPGAQNHVKER